MKYRRINAAKRKILEHIRDIKEKGKCKYCTESDTVCLEFHHRNPRKKKFRISEFWKYTENLGVVCQEIQKCDLICANCHKKVHNGKEL